VGPVLVPDTAKGRAFTAKVKIIEGGPVPAPANDAEKADRESPWANHAAAVVPAAALPSSHAPPVSLPEQGNEQENEQEQEKESASSGNGRSRGRAIAVAIAALGVTMAVGVWIVASGPGVVGSTPEPAVRGTATGAPAVVPSGAASAAVVPVGTAGVDAGASLAPSAVPGPAPYKGKSSAVKSEDPYDAAAPTPAPAKTVEPIAPQPSAAVPTVTPTAPPKPPVPVNPFDKPNYD